VPRQRLSTPTRLHPQRRGRHRTRARRTKGCRAALVQPRVRCATVSTPPRELLASRIARLRRPRPTECPTARAGPSVDAHCLAWFHPLQGYAAEALQCLSHALIGRRWRSGLGFRLVQIATATQTKLRQCCRTAAGIAAVPDVFNLAEHIVSKIASPTPVDGGQWRNRSRARQPRNVPAAPRWRATSHHDSTADAGPKQLRSSFAALPADTFQKQYVQRLRPPISTKSHPPPLAFCSASPPVSDRQQPSLSVLIHHF